MNYRFSSQLLAFTCVLLMNNAKGQDTTEFEIHLKSINETFSPYYPIDEYGSTDPTNANTEFVNYTIRDLLPHPDDKKYIADRSDLRRLERTSCDSSRVSFKDTLNSGETLDIELTAGLFIPEDHSIAIHPEHDYIQSIDGAYPWGGVYGPPETEIQSLSISVNGKGLSIPLNSYADLFEPDLCDLDHFRRPIEAFTSLSGEFIYLYIYGGDNAATYFCKLVFDQQSYVTRIIPDSMSLSTYSCFRPDFIGF